MKHTSEHGQAMIFIVIGFIVILGFVGLAIDGGMVFSDRRHAQNAADASSIAGGGKASLWLEDNLVTYQNWNCGNLAGAYQVAREAAKNRAATNDFEIDFDASDFNGVEITCTQYNYGSYIDKYIDITVWITTNTQGNFTRFLFPSALRSQVQSVTRVRPRMPLAFGYSVVSLNPGNCSGQKNGVTFHGASVMNIHFGGVFSNGCLRTDGGAEVNGHDGAGFSYVGQLSGGSGFNPSAQRAYETIPADAAYVAPPDCTHPDAINLTAAQLKASSPLAPGLYCVDGDLRINAQDTFRGTDVTIYMKNGEIRVNGGATVELYAPSTYSNPKPAIPGVLVYMAPGNNNDVQINGNSSSVWKGTIYAPESNIDFSGTENTNGYETQLIGWNVEVGGTGDTNIWYCSCSAYSKPTSMDLSR
jgi:Flp pilus assembly protein TadG